MAKKSNTVIGVLDEIANKLDSDTVAVKIQNVAEALDRIAQGVAPYPGIDRPKLADGPYEEVLVFEVQAQLQVGPTVTTDDQGNPYGYFRVWGNLADENSNPIPGSKFETVNYTAFPIPGETPFPYRYPACSQTDPPFDKPPVDDTNAVPMGRYKTQLTFGDGSTIAGVGPTLNKIADLPDGGAQYWVTGILFANRGTGRYSGIKAMITLNGSAYFREKPASPKAFATPVPMRMSVNVKFVRT